MTLSARICMVLTVLSLFSGSFGVYAQEDRSFDIKSGKRTFQELQEIAAAGTPERDTVSKGIKRATALRSDAHACVLDAEKELARLEPLIAAIKGPDETTASGDQGKIIVPKERKVVPKTLTRDLAQLEAQQEQAESRLAGCNLLLIQTDDLLEELSALQKRFLADLLSQRGLSAPALIWQVLKNSSAVGQQAWEAVNRFFDFSAISAQQKAFLFTMLVVMLAGGVVARRTLTSRVPPPRASFGSRLRFAVTHCLLRYAPLLLPAAAAYAVAEFLWPGHELPLLTEGARTLFFYSLALVAIRGVFASYAGGGPLVQLPERVVRHLPAQLKVFASLIMLSILANDLLDLTSRETLLTGFLHSLFLSLLIIVLMGITSSLAHFKETAGFHRLRVAAFLFWLFALGAGWLGYWNFSKYLAYGVFGTGLSLLALWIVDRTMADFYDGLNRGQHPWQAQLRWFLRLKPSEKIPGLIWFRLITWLLIWLCFILAALRFWGLSETGFALVTQYLVDGFHIGDLIIVPSKVLTGLLVFALLLSVVRWGRNTTELKLQQHTQLDAGARDALSSGILYAGFVAAILIGLSFVGVDFTKLAIIAGALSVGIGFGLQNVVSNFVSGVILLVERPVRPGDWVIIGNTQGFVTKVRVRATEIRTFDRSDVIVPNSQLISEQVTNWTLRDAYRRMVIPIGVAYGSDLQLVRDCLLNIARQHDDVVQDGPDLEPQAYFIAFEDSSLKFELRCYVRNAMRALSVTSDINFAIDKAFREAGIQIPFPHREVIIKGELPKPK